MIEGPHIDFLHEIGSRIATADEMHRVLERILETATAIVRCDSCFLYVLEGSELTLKASKNPHPDAIDRLKIPLGQGITGWVATHRKPVAIPNNAYQDARFRVFNDLPEDQFEAFLSVPLLCRGRVVGVINLQHRKERSFTKREITMLSTIGLLVGAEIELARLEALNSELSRQLETRKLVERAKGILQRSLGLTEEEAYLKLQRQSRQYRKSMREIAEAVILGDELKRSSS
ncbi:MAG: GAF domain-containing protein [Candidatus Korobacteraceae bacterium]